MLLAALFVFVGWIASVCLHEFGHAVVAYWGGDTSVKEKGYLTLNPLKYTNVSTSLVLPLIFLLLGGIPLPGAAVYINQQRLRNRWWQSAVSAAGPAATALVAVILSIPFKIGLKHLGVTLPNLQSFRDLQSLLMQVREQWIWYALAFLIVLEVAAVLLNLLPVPPFDGYGIIEPWLSAELQQRFRRWGRYGILVVFAALWLIPSVNQVFWAAIYAIAALLGVSQNMAIVGYWLFQQWAALMLMGMLAIVFIFRRFIHQPKLKVLSQPSELLQAVPDADLTKMRQYEEAIAVYDQRLMQKPDDYQGWYERGRLCQQWQHFSEALACCDRAVTIQPNFYTAWYLQGIVLQEMQWYRAAIVAFDQALKLEPESADAWYIKGAILGQLQCWDAAIAAYDRVLKLKPENVTVWDSRGKALANLHRYEDAITSYDRALELKPDDFSHVWASRGFALGRLRQDEAALSAYNRALQLAPDNAGIWYQRGLTLSELKRYEDTVLSCDRALNLDPRFLQAWRQRGLALRCLGAYVRAIATYEYALKLNPKNASLHTDLGFMDLLNNDLAAAEWELNTANQLDPHSPFPVFYLGLIQLLRSQPAAAQAWFKRGLGLCQSKDLNSQSYFALYTIATGTLEPGTSSLRAILEQKHIPTETLYNLLDSAKILAQSPETSAGIDTILALLTATQS